MQSSERVVSKGEAGAGAGAGAGATSKEQRLGLLLLLLFVAAGIFVAAWVVSLLPSFSRDFG